MYGLITSPIIRQDKNMNPITITSLPIVAASKADDIAEMEKMTILPPINIDLKYLATFLPRPSETIWGFKRHDCHEN